MKKKNVAIVTIQSMNYGNRLQNYALQQVLIKRGLRVVTLSRKKEGHSIKDRIKNALLIIRDKKRYDKFLRFDRKILWSRDVLCNENKGASWNEKYDCFIAGSDQIWNPNFNFLSDIEYLSFAEPSKRVSYAASFGVDFLPDSYRIKICDELKKFRYISVREESAVNLIYELTGRKGYLAADPTMLLGIDEWRSIECKPKLKNIEKPFVLIYFLGGKKDAIQEILNHVPKEYEIVNVPAASSKKEFPAGPSEFLWLVDHAEFVITDSFHGSVFSIIFHTNFINVERNLEQREGDMNTRLSSLLKMFQLDMNRYVNNNTDYEACFHTAFDRADDILSEQIKESNRFLDMIFSEEVKNED